MDNKYLREESEHEFVISHFILEMLKHWKSLVLLLLIGGMLGGGYSYFQQLRVQTKQAGVNENIESDAELEKDVLENMELAYQYRLQYDSQKRYNADSIVMKLDPNGYYAGYASYYISAKKDVDALLTKCQSIVSNDQITSEMCAAADIEGKEPYIQEVIWVSIYTPTEAVSEAILKASDLVEGDGYSWIITLSVAYPEKQECDSILQVFQQWLETVVDEECQGRTDIVFEKIRESVQIKTNGDYRNTQKTNIDRLNSLYTSYTKIEDSFSEDELSYYQNRYLPKTDEAEVSISLKMVIVFAFIGGVCWACIWGVRYLLDDNIRTCQEYQELFSVPILGGVRGLPVSSNRLILSQERISQKVCGLSSKNYLADTVNSLETSNVAFIDVASLKESNDIASEIASGCMDSVVIDSLMDEKTNFAELKKVKGVVYCIPFNRVTNAQFRRELDICWTQKIHVLGVIFVF